MLPKFHKNLIDYRYIAVGTIASTKYLAKILSAMLKLLSTTLQQYSKYKFKFDNTSGFWIVKNKEATINHLTFLNNIGKTKNIKSFDFKKLYTNLPHAKVLEKIIELILLCYGYKDSKYINISKMFTASWSNRGIGHWGFTKEEFVEMLTFLLENIFVKFGSSIFKQVIGIPMGCDCAPFVADLFLFAYEYSFITNNVLVRNPIVYDFKFCSRYIDDLNNPNCSDKVVNTICKEIYPPELDIVITNPNDELKCTFLDLDINISLGKFSTKLYDKRRDFQFNVITFPNLKSCVPSKQAYGIFMGELFRLCTSSSGLADFIIEVRRLIEKLEHQNFDKNMLYKYLNKFLRCKPSCLNKYWANLNIGMFY